MLKIKILVFSDTHGKSGNMYDIISRKRLSTDVVIHLGDNFTDLYDIKNKFPEIAFISVVGNCDNSFSSFNIPMSQTITLEGKKIFITHGHHQSVKSGLDVLKSLARKNKIDIVLYGHTHVADFKEIDGVYYFNPGSLSLPRSDKCASYGVIDIENNNSKFSIEEINE